jgi:iron complex transport system ATP-binding protein
MITAQGLTLKLGGNTVVNAIDATLAPGRVTAIIGPNGAGKTSLLRAVAGLLVPDAGAISLDGQPITAIDPKERAKLIGYLPQGSAPTWAVSARELVALGRQPHRPQFVGPTSQDKAAIDAAMTATDTAHLAERTVDTLSGGERARVQFARVLAGEPRWILADEPLANLDPPHQRDLLNLLRAAAGVGCGVIVVLHQLDAAAQVADDIVMMREGRVVAQGSRQTALTAATLEATFDMAFELIEHKNRTFILS